LPIKETQYTPAKELALVICVYIKFHQEKQKKTINLIDKLLSSHYFFENCKKHALDKNHSF